MKLIPHIINATSEAMAWASHSSMYKRLDASGPIVRKYWPDSEQNSRIANMAVDATFNDIMAVVGSETKYVEVFNEVAQRQGLGLEQHADFIEAIVPKFHAHGLKVAGFSFSTGNPGCAVFHDRDDFQYLFNRNWCGVDAVALHEYWGPKGFDEAYALRHRALTAGVPSHPPIIITECGRDAVEGGKSGWKASGLTPQQYVNELLAYDAELQKDKYILWAAVFTAGPTIDWVNFSTDDLGSFWSSGGDAPTMADFVIGPGFKAKIQEKGWHEASDEVYFSQTANAKLSVVSCDEGLMFYDSSNNKIGTLTFDA